MIQEDQERTEEKKTATVIINYMLTRTEWGRESADPRPRHDHFADFADSTAPTSDFWKNLLQYKEGVNEGGREGGGVSLKDLGSFC